MKWVGVLPFTYTPFYHACVNTMHPDFKKNVLFIDNTDPDKNIGCMASHNRGIDYMHHQKADWLLVLSPAIRFGKTGGLDVIEELETHPGHHVLEAAGVFGWHCIAFSKECLDRIGRWDENFTLYGFDDIDISLRIQLAYNIDGHQTQVWEKMNVDVKDTIMGHSIKLAHIESPANPRIEYFERKWNRHPGAYKNSNFKHPFGDTTKDISWWPTPPDPRALDHGYWARLRHG